MQERFAVAYPITLWPSGTEVMAIKSRYPTMDALKTGYERELAHYMKTKDPRDKPPKKVEILSAEKCRILQ